MGILELTQPWIQETQRMTTYNRVRISQSEVKEMRLSSAAWG